MTTSAGQGGELDRILEAAHEAFISMDEAGRVVAWNREAERTFGWTKEAALGALLRDLVIPERYRDMHEAGLERFLATGEGRLIDRRFDITALHRDGHEFPVEMTISAVRAETWTFHAFVHDVTDRYRAHELQARLATLVEHSADAIITRTEDGRITSWNSGAEQLFGYAAEEMLGASMERLVPEARAGEADDLLERVLRGEAVRGYETERVCKDGRLLDVSITISPIRDETGQVREISLIARDVTARKQAERSLAQANAELEKANELKSRFVAIASHELRTPLTSIGGFAKTLLARWDELDPQRKVGFLALIDEQSDRLARIVEDLLTLSRIQAGKVPAQPASVDVADVARRVLAELGLTAETRVAVSDGSLVRADADHVHHILVNYLANARAHGAPPYAIELEGGDETVVVRVTDSGPGVPEAFVPELFETFAQASPAAPGGHGTGLGLAIVRGLAETFDGDAWYEPNDPCGARFCVSFPRAS